MCVCNQKRTAGDLRLTLVVFVGSSSTLFKQRNNIVRDSTMLKRKERNICGAQVLGLNPSHRTMHKVMILTNTWQNVYEDIQICIMSCT